MKINKNFLLLFSFGFAALLLSLFKLSPIFGSYRTTFSGINFLIPVLGYFIRPLFLPFTILFFLLKKITLGGALTLGIPSFFATLVISVASKKNVSGEVKYEIYDFLLRVVLPITAIVLFVVNPVGRVAFLYSFYWFIPVGLFFASNFFNKKSIFTDTLSATFIAHAIGSLIWLYTLKTTSLYWSSLIPIVAIERFIFAVGMNLSFIFINKIIGLKPLFLKLRSMKCFLKLN